MHEWSENMTNHTTIVVKVAKWQEMEANAMFLIHLDRQSAIHVFKENLCKKTDNNTNRQNPDLWDHSTGNSRCRLVEYQMVDGCGDGGIFLCMNGHTTELRA